MHTNANYHRRDLLRIGGTAALFGLASCSALDLPEDRAVNLIAPLRDYIRKRQSIENIPGVAFVIATPSRIIHAEGFGVTRVSASEAVTADTVFQIGSTTKAFLAATLAVAVDDGVIGWDESLVSLEPSFGLSDATRTQQVTPADVLAHTTGLPAYTYDAMWVLGYPLASRLRALASVPLTAGYREYAQYVNNLHALVGAVIARRAGTPNWEAFLQQRILTPSGMTRSSATQSELYASVGHAWGHQHDEGRIKELQGVGRYWYETGVGPGGGINSTANDMGRWLRLQLSRGELDGRRIVSSAGLQRTWHPLISNGDTGSALGWGVLNLPQGRLISHDGGTASFGSNVMLLPDHGIGIAVLTNHAQEGLPFAISRWFTRQVLGEATGDLRADFRRAPDLAKPATTELARPAVAYAGRFDSPSLGVATVTARNEILAMTLHEVGASLSLRPVGNDRFLAEVLAQGRFTEVVEEGFNPVFAMEWRFDSSGRPTVIEVSSASGAGYDTHLLQAA